MSRGALPARGSRRWRILSGLAGVVIVSVGLFLLTRDVDRSPATAAAPDITLAYFDGSTEALSDLVGQPVVLNFWASWCPACVSELPSFAEVHRQYQDRVAFVGINMQEVSLYAAADLVERTGVEYRLAHDPDGAIFNAFGGVAMPTTVFVDSDGSVVRVFSGSIFAEDLVAVIEADLLG